MTPEQLIERGRQAKDILESPLFQEAMAFVRTDILTSIANSKPHETEERERLYMAVKVLEHAQEFLTLTLQNGESEKVAKQQTDKI